MDEAMNTTPAVPAIYDAILGIMEDVGVISKDSKNEKHGYNFRGIDAVMNALQPALIKRRVIVIPNVIEHRRDERVTGSGNTMIYSTIKIRYAFVSAEDGSGLSAVVIGEGMDTGDKASNKAMSVAFKYACFQVLCIPTEEMVDPDADTPEPSRDAGAALEAAKREAASLGIDPVKVSNYYKVPVDQLGLREYNDAIRMKRERGAR